MELVEHRPAKDRPLAPLCSVCIAHYRGPELLATCIASVLQQDCDFEYEIIVHDDVSNDGSLELLGREYPQAEVLVSTENVGFCIANNRMVAQARGQFVLLLNNDAALFPDALSALVKASAQSPTGILTLPQYEWESGELVDRGCLLDPFYNPVPNLDPTRTEVAMVIGACLWIERSDWNQLGGFPEWLESVGEDLYLCCAARLAGLPVRALTHSGYRHRQGHSFGGNKPSDGQLVSSFRRRRLSERNKTFVLFVMTPTILMWPLLGLHLILLAIEGALLSLLRLDLEIGLQIYWNIGLETAKNSKTLLRQRQLIQRWRSIIFLEYMRAFIMFPRKFSMLIRYGLPRIRK
jgi:GT2 family glycosyltransferase